MQALLVFDGRALYKEAAFHAEPTVVAAAANAFFDYVLAHQAPADGIPMFTMREFAEQGYLTLLGKHRAQATYDQATGEISTANWGEVYRTVITLLMRHCLNDLVVLIREISNEYGIYRLQYHKLTPTQLLVVAHCRHLIPDLRKEECHAQYPDHAAQPTAPVDTAGDDAHSQ